LERLREFIARKNPAAAMRISQQLMQSIQSLAEQPSIGHVLEEEPEVLEWVAKPYVVHYTVRAGSVIVLQIWHGKEDR